MYCLIEMQHTADTDNTERPLSLFIAFTSPHLYIEIKVKRFL
jgi:hypothetical protein